MSIVEPATAPKSRKPAPSQAGVGAAVRAIDPGLIYTLREFRRITGIGDFAMRRLRRDGLRVLEAADRKQFIYGRDFLDFLLKQANGREANGNDSKRHQS